MYKYFLYLREKFNALGASWILGCRAFPRSCLWKKEIKNLYGELTTMENKHLTGYGERNCVLTHISQVKTGLACKCVCIACGKDFIAKKGKQRIHHFAHRHNSNCQGAPETLLHRLCKEIFTELKYINLPPYIYKKTYKLKSGSIISHNEEVVKGGEAIITNVSLEQNLYGFTPDIILECGTKKLIVEIAVTHKVDRLKLRKIREADVPAIEIQLHLDDTFASKIELTSKLRDAINTKQWLYHPKQKVAERNYIKSARNSIKQSKRIIPKSNQNKPLSQYYLGAGGTNSPQEGFAIEFYRKNGRYPLMNECLLLRPNLFKKLS